MSAWLVVLLVLASWRTWALTARDLILDRWRNRWAKPGSTRRDWLECPYCAGFWWASVWTTGAWLVMWEPVTVVSVGLWFATWWAVAAGVVFVEMLVDLVSEYNGG